MEKGRVERTQGRGECGSRGLSVDSLRGPQSLLGPWLLINWPFPSFYSVFQGSRICSYLDSARPDALTEIGKSETVELKAL